MKANLQKKLQQPSGRSSPIFPWSPLPQRRHLNFIEKKVNPLQPFAFLLHRIKPFAESNQTSQ